jgi:hypothetical protein
MNKKYQIGMFGKFEWSRTDKEKIDGEWLIRTYPFSIEGAIIEDIDRNDLFLRGTDDMVYIVPKAGVVYTPMTVPSGLFKISVI